MRHRRCISAILMSFVLFLQPVYAVPPEENQPENSQENNTENEKRQQEQISAPSAILMEASTGQIIYEKNPDEKLPPASVTKVMTLLLIFDALESGQIKLADEVTTSEYAASMGGSQVFLEPGETQTVDTLIKCISVASANDACVSMAEYICGNEEEFVAKMNKRAKNLGMKNTHFVNCNGLDADGHLTTARDIALMSKELIITYPQIFDYCNIWMENITHKTQKGESEFGLTNTNKLIRQYEYATGLKTGSTSKAKFCVSATGRKGRHRSDRRDHGSRRQQSQSQRCDHFIELWFRKMSEIYRKRTKEDITGRSQRRDGKRGEGTSEKYVHLRGHHRR